jgi:hypothetical protein
MYNERLNGLRNIIRWYMFFLIDKLVDLCEPYRKVVSILLMIDFQHCKLRLENMNV